MKRLVDLVIVGRYSRSESCPPILLLRRCPRKTGKRRADMVVCLSPAELTRVTLSRCTGWCTAESADLGIGHKRHLTG